jgi:hypothetical protein
VAERHDLQLRQLLRAKAQTGELQNGSQYEVDQRPNKDRLLRDDRTARPYGTKNPPNGGEPNRRTPHASRARVLGRRRFPGSRRYFPREIFFFGFGFLVVPVLPGAGSFFGRFGDTDSLLPVLAVLRCPRVRIRSVAPSRPVRRPARRNRSETPACQSTEPSRPKPETAIVNGYGKRARPAKVARRRLPVSSGRPTATSRLSQQSATRIVSGSKEPRASGPLLPPDPVLD